MDRKIIRNISPCTITNMAVGNTADSFHDLGLDQLPWYVSSINNLFSFYSSSSWSEATLEHVT